jgi:hypothetical protein
VEDMAKKSKTEAIFIDEKKQKQNKTKQNARLGTQATQSARDRHPPWLSKQSNIATDNRPMGI